MVYECDKCDYKGTGLSCLKQHKQSIHDIVAAVYECGQCEYTTTQPQYLNIHK